MKKMISAVLAAAMCVMMFAGVNDAGDTSSAVSGTGEKEKLIMATEAALRPMSMWSVRTLWGIDVEIAKP